MNLNKVTIAGNLTRDPETRFSPKGTPVAQFGVAVNRKWTAEGGEKKEEVTFLDVEAWGKTAENIAKFFSKGRAIYVEGRLKLEQWEDKDTGKKRSKLKIVAETFQFVGSKGDDAAPEKLPLNGGEDYTSPKADPPTEKADDVPF